MLYNVIKIMKGEKKRKMKRYFKLAVDTGYHTYEDFVVIESDFFESEEELEREVQLLASELKDNNVSEYYEELTEEEAEEDYYDDFF